MVLIVTGVVQKCLVILFGALGRITLLHPLVLGNEMGIEMMYGFIASA